jgi:N-methylhydantoinase A
MPGSQHLAVDIGGTFVDSITFDRESESINVEKASTTPADPTEGVTNAIEKVGANLPDTTAFVHGTTLGINALLEREGAKAGIITNEGFRDIYEIARTNLPRDSMYDIRYEKPESLVSRRRRIGVTGRLDQNGEEIEPLDEAGVREAARELVEDWGVEAIAVCFLHSYQNDDHEVRAGEIIAEEFDDVSLSLSSAITREYREYERTSTAVLDAYIKPIFDNYVDKLDSTLRDRDFDGSFFFTRSGGGALTAENATTAPVHTILSGPAGGLIGAASVGEEIGREDLIAVDLGGTSMDACVIEEGTPAVEYQSSLEEMPMMIPVFDIRTIGAGGGSIAWLDGDLLKVGPRSAGADPGPICYDLGGTDPTVTDAALALGYLDPEEFLGGEMVLDEAGATKGIERDLADPLGLSVRDVSTGVFEVTMANTVGAIREITVEKGLDPRDFTMVAYGGAGPMFVPLVAREMAVPEVLVPQAPGVFSAWGMLMADVVYDESQTFIRVLDDIEYDDLDQRFTQLATTLRERLTEEGFDADDQRLERYVEMRYLGQEHTVSVPADGLTAIEGLGARFEESHESRYGHTMEDPPEVVHLRVRAIGENDKPELVPEETAPNQDPSPVATREAYCFAREGIAEFDVYEREELAPGHEVAGPTIVQEPTTTIVIHSDQTATVDDYGHLLISGGDAR